MVLVVEVGILQECGKHISESNDLQLIICFTFLTKNWETHLIQRCINLLIAIVFSTFFITFLQTHMRTPTWLLAVLTRLKHLLVNMTISFFTVIWEDNSEHIFFLQYFAIATFLAKNFPAKFPMFLPAFLVYFFQETFSKVGITLLSKITYS